jgi:hypothetical protein
MWLLELSQNFLEFEIDRQNLNKKFKDLKHWAQTYTKTFKSLTFKHLNHDIKTKLT